MKCKPNTPCFVTRHQIQGSIQQLLLKSDVTAPDDQCEEDDPYVSLHKQNMVIVGKFNWKSFCERGHVLVCNHGTTLSSAGRRTVLHKTPTCLQKVFFHFSMDKQHKEFLSHWHFLQNVRVCLSTRFKIHSVVVDQKKYLTQFILVTCYILQYCFYF